MTEVGGVPAGEAADTRLKRVRIRAWRRGMREMDLILGDFVDREGASLGEGALSAFEALLERPDPDLYAWFARSDVPQDASAAEIALVACIRGEMETNS